MTRIAKNKSIDFLRRKIHIMRGRTISNENGIEILQCTTEQKTDKIGLRCLVAKLSKEHSCTIDLIYYKGYTLVEVSDNLSMPFGTIKTRLRRAIGSLRREFSFEASLSS